MSDCPQKYSPRLSESRSKIYCFLKAEEDFIQRAKTNKEPFTLDELFECNHPEFAFSRAIIQDFGEDVAKRIAKTLLGSLEDYDGR